MPTVEPTTHAEPMRLDALAQALARPGTCALAVGLACQDWLGQTRCTSADLARKLGRNPSTISRAIARAEALAPELGAAVRRGQFPAEVADLIAGEKDQDRQRQLARRVAAGELDRAGIAAEVRRSSKLTTTLIVSARPVRITMTIPAAAGLDEVEAAVRDLIGDLRRFHDRSVTQLRGYLAAKSAAVRKAAEAKAAMNALDHHLRAESPSAPRLGS